MNLTFNLIMCGVLVAVTVGVGIYRKWMEDHCDNYIHLRSHESTLISTQAAVCKKIGVLDKVRTGLIVAVILYAVAIAGFATYDAWLKSGQQ